MNDDMAAIVREEATTISVPGLPFVDLATGQSMRLYMDTSSGWDLWLFRRGPDGQWVSVRKATEKDKDAILRAYHRQLSFTLTIRL